MTQKNMFKSYYVVWKHGKMKYENNDATCLNRTM